MNGLAFNKVFAILIHICMVSSYFRFLPIKIDSKLSRNIIDSNLRAFLIQKKNCDLTTVQKMGDNGMIEIIS